MADPLEGILDVPPVPPPAPPPPVDPAAPVVPDNKEGERLAAENARLQTLLEQQGGQINDLRAQFAQSQAPIEPEQTDDDAAFYQDPNGTARRIAQEAINKQVGPQAREINTKLGRMAVANFTATKVSDPLYSAVLGVFNKSMETVPLDQLGAAPDGAVMQMLNVAWDSAVGKYVQAERSRRIAASPPPNLGGGGAGGAGGAKKTLAELDPQAYNMAVRAGLSEDDMKKIATELEEEG